MLKQELLKNIRTLKLEEKLPWEKINSRGEKVKVSRKGPIIFEAILNGQNIHGGVSSVGLGLQKAGQDLAKFRIMLDFVLQNPNLSVGEIIEKIEAAPTVSSIQKKAINNTENRNYIEFLSNFFKILQQNMNEVMPIEKRKPEYTEDELNEMLNKAKLKIKENMGINDELIFKIHPIYLKKIAPIKSKSVFMAKISKLFGGKE